MFRKHPKGLTVLFFTEMWERFGFYIMMAILVLYMDKEFNWEDSKKGDYYGIFLGAVYFIPLFGGWLGDRILGQIVTIRWGALFMVFGYLSLAYSSSIRMDFFYIGLFLVAFGTGIFKVNMSVLLGNLYSSQAQLKDTGFNIYYMGVNVGAAAAPLAATMFGNLYDSYNVSFLAAAVGMVICIIIFEKGKKQLSGADTKSKQDELVEFSPQKFNTEEDTQRIMTLITLFIIVIFFWVAFYQNGFALTLFAERSTLRSDLLRPETYQFFNPFFILLLTPVLVKYFSHLNKKGKEPATPVKILAGMIIMTGSMIIMVFASLLGGNLDEAIMSPSWLITTYLIVTLAEILISPMGQSFVTKVSPARFQGVMMGGWFAATAAGSYGSGLLGKFYSDFDHHQYFLILASLLVFSVIMVVFF